MKLIILISLLLLVFYLPAMSVYKGHYMHKSHTLSEKKIIEKRLKKLRKDTQELIERLHKVSPENPITQRLSRWFGNWRGEFHEMEHRESPRAFGYNVEKGKYIAVCLHDARNRPNAYNEIFFVLLHELAHIATDNYAHDVLFWDAFRYLIRVASDAGLYKNTDYAKYPKTFCHNTLKSNPTFF